MQTQSISQVVVKKAASTKITKEFKEWLHSFLKEDKDLLNELATR